MIIPEFKFSSYKLGLSLGNWLGHSGFSSEHHRKATFAIHVVGDYLWLIGGLVLIWIGLIGMYVIYSTGMPSSPSLGVFAGAFCLYRFVKIRTRRRI